MIRTVSRKAFLAAVILLTSCLDPTVRAAAEPEVVWSRTAGPEHAAAESVTSAPDGGFVATGRVTDADGWQKLLLLKTDAEGKEVWSRYYAYAASLSASGKKVHRTQDGGFVIVGTVRSGDHGKPNDDVYLVKTDARGELEWERRFVGGGEELGQDVTELPDGGYLIAGTYVNGSIPARAGLLIRTDSAGNERWTKRFGSLEDQSGISFNVLTPLQDGSYLIGGQRSASFASPDSGAYLLDVDTEGTVRWEHTYGSGSTVTAASDVVQTRDGGLIVTGQTTGTQGRDLYLLKLDAGGGQQWQASLPGAGDELGQAVLEASDGGYVIAGTKASAAEANKDAYVVKTDAQGKAQWERTLGGGDHDQGSAVLQTAPGIYVVAGTTYHPADGSGRMLLAKLSEAGMQQPGEEPVRLALDRETYILKPGASVPAAVYAVYRNRDRQPLGEGVNFYVNDPTVAYFGSGGLLTGKTAGTTFITAEYQGRTTVANVKVIDPEAPQLTGLSADPERLMLHAGEIGVLRIYAHYSDGSSRDITSEAAIYINDPKIGSVQRDRGVLAGRAGSTFLTAVYGEQSVVIDLTVE